MNKLLFGLLLSLSLVACNNDKPSTTQSSPQSSSVASSAVAVSAFSGEHTRLVGRFDLAEAGKARFTWSGSSMEFVFEGSRAQLRIASNERARFEVAVDGSRKDLWLEPGEHIYTLAEGLSQGTHQLRVTRLTESFAIVTAFTSDPLVDGQLLPAPAAPERRLLVIGDSITAGYGVEGEDQHCHYAHDTSNQQLTYAALAARALGADLHSIAWSGIGAWRSYGEETPVSPNILVRYQRTLANDPDSRWDTAHYQPQAVVINIGTNDYWQGSVSEDYRIGMQALINQVQSDYPQVPLYLMASPMLGGEARESQVEVLKGLANSNAGVTFADPGRIESGDGLGCDYHPNITTQTRLGEALKTLLAEDLGW
jgi:lysophospholipase L1-like esterase